MRLLPFTMESFPEIQRRRLAKHQWTQLQLLFHRGAKSGICHHWLGEPHGDCQALAGFCLFFVDCLTQLESEEFAAKARGYLSAEIIMFDVSGHFYKM